MKNINTFYTSFSWCIIDNDVFAVKYERWMWKLEIN